MDLLLVFALAALAGGAMIGLVVVWSTQRAANSAITSYFKASEHILDTGEPPPHWLLKRRRWWFLPARSQASKVELISRFDELVRFFEQCRFFEDDWAREQMLAQLAAIREDWQSRSMASFQLYDRPHAQAPHDDSAAVRRPPAIQRDRVDARRV